MPLITVAAVAAASFLPMTTTGTAAPEALHLAQAQPFFGTQGVVGPQGDYMTTAEGCTYRRTQAPGYPVHWIIVQNPHHIGKTGTRHKCKGML